MHTPSVPNPTPSRRDLLKGTLAATAAAMLAHPVRVLAQQPGGTKPVASKPETKSASPSAAEPFKISLAQWSLHNALYAGTLDHLDFPKTAKADYGIDAVEYVNSFFKQKAAPDYIAELKKRCTDLGVTSVLIMCDGEGAIGDPDAAKRTKAVENHHKWVEAAAALGCHSIRVNAQSEGSPEEQQKLAADGLRRLCEFGDSHNINVIVENHGGLSSHGDWLAGVMKLANHPRAGTLPDFGNFYEYDRYQGVKDMMPFAKGVSAKSYDFDEHDNETKLDYPRLLDIVLAANYHGRIGIEYEGKRLSEPEGIRATKRLLERLRLSHTK